MCNQDWLMDHDESWSTEQWQDHSLVIMRSVPVSNICLFLKYDKKQVVLALGLQKVEWWMYVKM